MQIDNSFGQIKPFTFNEAFGEETSQEEMFEGCGIKHLVEMAVEGLVPGNLVIFSFFACSSLLWETWFLSWDPQMVTIQDSLTNNYSLRPVGVLPEKLGGIVQTASQNPYPIYDQNL